MSSVLIIDDDPEHRKVVRHLVNRTYPSAEVVEHDVAASGFPAGISDVQRYDLVITDSTVAGEDALEWMRSVILHYEDAPAFIIFSSISDPSAAATTRVVVQAIKQGAVNFLFKKKLDIRHFKQEITQVLNEAEQEKQSAIAPEKSVSAHASMDDTMAELNLAMDMVNGHNKKWPFSLNDILEGKAVLGKYRITAYLGDDDAASTFLALMPAINKPIVIKLVNNLRMLGKAIPERFVEKFEAIEHRRHENIIHLFNYEVIQGRMVVAIEYLQGGTLEQRILDGRIDESQAINLFRQLLDGMAALHELDLELHELMPKQIMFRDERTLVITHLGLINMLHALAEITGEWALPNLTPVYTTPEAVQKQPTDARSDVYLAGLIAFEMLTGEPLFSKGSDQDILYAHAAEPPRSLPDPRHPMNKLLQDMLHKIPDKRPMNASEALGRLNMIYPPDLY